MNVPNVLTEKMVDEKGYLTPAWRQYHTQMNSQMNTYLSNEGIVIPKQNTEDTTKILTSSTSPVGKILYDSQTNQLKVNINGVIKIIQIA